MNDVVLTGDARDVRLVVSRSLLARTGLTCRPVRARVRCCRATDRIVTGTRDDRRYQSVVGPASDLLRPSFSMFGFIIFFRLFSLDRTQHGTSFRLLRMTAPLRSNIVKIYIYTKKKKINNRRVISREIFTEYP